MAPVFADAVYYLALLNPRDALHARALEQSRVLISPAPPPTCEKRWRSASGSSPERSGKWFKSHTATRYSSDWPGGPDRGSPLPRERRPRRRPWSN